MWGLGHIWRIVIELLAGRSKRLLKVELSERPNLLALYLLAVLGALFKPRWTNARTLPPLEVALVAPSSIDKQRLKSFKSLAAWQHDSADHIPSLFFMAECFRLCMAMMTLPAFPVSIMGGLVNRKARYCLRRSAGAGERSTYACRLGTEVRETFSGHAEFDLHLEAKSADKGDVVWQAVLTLVLMNPKKKRRGRDANKEAPPADGAAPSLEPLDTWVLPEDTGRRYAALDGDISPMHLNKWTARLSGFPAPVANVHFLAGRVEASLATRKGGGALAAPYTLDVGFKKPTLLPNCLAMSGMPGGQEFSTASKSTTGYKWQVLDKKERLILQGCLSRSLC